MVVHFFGAQNGPVYGHEPVLLARRVAHGADDAVERAVSAHVAADEISLGHDQYRADAEALLDDLVLAELLQQARDVARRAGQRARRSVLAQPRAWHGARLR